MTEDSKSDKFLPAARIKTIMKSSADPDVLNIKDESLHIVCRATEMFIQLLTKKSHDFCDNKTKIVDYKQLAKFVQSEDYLEFLHQILPNKITVKEFRKIMENEKTPGSSDETSSSEDESDSESSSSVEEVK